MAGYKFIFPPPAELEVRRTNLNTAGVLAWLSPPSLLLLVALTRFLSTLLAKHTIKNSTSYDSAIRLWRKISWILSTTYISEYGPLYIQLIGLVYAGWLTYLAFRNTGEDYMHLTKQFGHIAVSQLPWQYLLAFKSPYFSPFTLATGLTHERLNAFHRLYGRIIHALLAVHVGLYLNFFWCMGLLAKRIQDRDVGFGIVAFWIFNLLGILAVPIIRRRAYYKLFYRSHVVLTAVAPVALWFHQPWTRWYLLQAAAFYLANGLARNSATVAGTIVAREKLAGKDLVKLVVHLKSSNSPNGLAVAGTILPGQHVYLRTTRKKGSLIPPTNPFTVLNVASNRADGSTELTFVIRALGGPGTKFQHQHQHQHSRKDNESTANGAGWLLVDDQILIEGPYGEAQQYLPQLLHESAKGPAAAGQILLVAGGVGATYALPIYKVLAEAVTAGAAATATAAATAPAANHTTNGVVKLIWFVKSTADAQWGIDYLEHHAAAFLRNVDIYIKDCSGAPSSTHDLSVHYVLSRPDISSLLERVISAQSADP